MPQICTFYGITIFIHYDDHPEPHFHAFYGGREVTVASSKMRREMLRIRKVAPIRDHRVRLTLTSGDVVERDLSALLGAPSSSRSVRTRTSSAR